MTSAPTAINQMQWPCMGQPWRSQFDALSTGPALHWHANVSHYHRLQAKHLKHGPDKIAHSKRQHFL